MPRVAGEIERRLLVDHRAVLDCALVMRRVPVTWDALPALAG